MTATAAFLAAVVVFVLATLPSSPQHVSGADMALASRIVGGAFHVHTTRSDGLGDHAQIAAAARRAGLQFVVFTDHGDGTRTPDPPRYVDGVLCLDGVEISTSGGHYISIGAGPSAYPLGGESAAVWEDVRRLGGFGIAAHPASPRPELAWSDWSVPVDGVEWLNADSEWRDEGRWNLTRAFAGYLLRPAGALAGLLDRPVTALARWDAMARDRRVLAIAGHDAHGGIGRRLEDPSRRRSVHVPSYEASFRAFSTRAVLDRPLTGDAAADGPALLDALRAGRFYTAIDAVATGSTFAFIGRTAEGTAGQGDQLSGAGVASFSARAAVPTGATIVAFRNGAEVARASGGTLEFRSAEMGAHRVEVHVPGAPGEPPVPWLVSNPIFRGPLADCQPRTANCDPPRERSEAVSLHDARWRIEKEGESAGEVLVDDKSGEVRFEYRLRDGPRVSQFVALVTDLPRDLPPFDAVSFVARASAPSRVSVQFRFAGDGDARWGRSAYIDSSARTVTVPLDAFRRADGPPDRPAATRATSLLFVVDLTNANPGASGVVRVNQIRLAR